MKGELGKKFEIVAAGGTFDELHKGHRALLAKAFEIGERVQIGLCSDDFVKKLGKPHITAPYDQRLAELKTFLRTNGLSERAEVFPLDDPFGITLSNGGIKALVVSKETEPTALQINKKRKEAGLLELQIVTISMVPSENHFPISTTRIRCGEIDREGHLLRT
jgi:pantetheine-phosphate adenylyltransferase